MEFSHKKSSEIDIENKKYKLRKFQKIAKK